MDSWQRIAQRHWLPLVEGSTCHLLCAKALLKPMMKSYELRNETHWLPGAALIQRNVHAVCPRFSAGTRRNNNVFTTSTRRRRRRVDVVKTLSLRHYCVMCPLGYVLFWFIHGVYLPTTRMAISIIPFPSDRTDSGYWLSRWETTLHYNVVFHWLSSYPYYYSLSYVYVVWVLYSIFLTV